MYCLLETPYLQKLPRNCCHGDDRSAANPKTFNPLFVQACRSKGRPLAGFVWCPSFGRSLNFTQSQKRVFVPDQRVLQLRGTCFSAILAFISCPPSRFNTTFLLWIPYDTRQSCCGVSMVTSSLSLLMFPMSNFLLSVRAFLCFREASHSCCKSLVYVNVCVCVGVCVLNGLASLLVIMSCSMVSICRGAGWGGGMTAR